MAANPRAENQKKREEEGAGTLSVKLPRPGVDALAVPVPGTQTAGATAIYRSVLTPDRLVDCNPETKARTLYRVFEHTLSRHPNNACLGTRRCPLTGQPARTAVVSSTGAQLGPDTTTPFVWITYAQAARCRDELGSGVSFLLKTLAGLQEFPKSTDQALTTKVHNVGIYSMNRPEWLLADIMCNAFSMATVAIYDTLGSDTARYIISQAELPVIFASIDRISTLLPVLSKSPCSTLKCIVCMDDYPFILPTALANIVAKAPAAPLGEDHCGFVRYGGTGQPAAGNVAYARSLGAWAQSLGITVLSFAQLRALGRVNKHPHVPPSPDTVAIVCYTSGTTGDPKGAMLTHNNMAAQNVFVYLGYPFTHTDVYLSYLPLAHIFERCGILQALGAGARIGFFSGTVDALPGDILALRPTFFISVPRLLNRIYAKMRESTVDAPGLVGALFRRAFEAKTRALKNGTAVAPLKHPYWDPLLFNQVAKKVLGGRVRVIISGSAPLDGEVLTFFRVFFSCDVLEGFGQTENAAAATVQVPGETRTGSVGAPLVHVELKLKDVPEMGYHSTDKPRARGEVCLRGPVVFKGYLKDQKNTRSALDEHGWLHTGDIGELYADGGLRIIDRKKNIFKLAQGEYVAPEKIENVYMLNPLVAQIFVHGDPLQDCLVGVVVPDPAQLAVWAKKHDLTEHDLSGFKARKLILRDLDITAQSHKLNGFERIRNVWIEVKDPFSVENNLLTPSFKLKRPLAAEKYKEKIQQMYAELKKKSSSSNNTLAKM